jgi:hypothetical protein
MNDLKALLQKDREHSITGPNTWQLTLDDFTWNREARTLTTIDSISGHGPIPHFLNIAGVHYQVRFYNKRHDFTKRCTIFSTHDDVAADITVELRWETE